jgi:hypothetical protein
MYGESPFNRFESTKLGNDDNSALKLLVGRATWGNVIIMIGGGVRATENSATQS